MEVVQFGISHSNSVVSLSLFLFFSILPLCLCLTRSLSPLCCVNRGEKEVRAWQALPRITRDINFTFQRLLLSLSLSSFRAWLSNICRRVLLPGTLFSSLKVVTDRLTGSTIFFCFTNTHIHTHTAYSVLCYCVHFVVLKSFHPPFLVPFEKKSSCRAQGGTQNSWTQLAAVLVCYNPPYCHTQSEFNSVIPTLNNGNKTRKTTKEKKTKNNRK